jgi:hypothetical protein
MADGVAWRGSRLVALSGLGYAILVFLGSAVIGGTSGAGRHSLDASEADVASYVQDADPTRVWAGEYVAVLGYALFALFAAYAWTAAGRGDVRQRHSAATLGPAYVYVALALVGTACLAPVLNRTGDPAAAARFLDLRSALFAIAFVFFAIWLAGVGLRARATRMLPRWLGWGAVVIAALQVVGTAFATIDPGFTGVPTFAGFLWVAIVSVLLARRADAET